jgi:hypothetical protein
MQFGPNYVITFTVVLSMTQTLGALTGSALLGTYQFQRSQVYATALGAQLNPADPQVALRLQQQSGLYRASIGDPALRTAQGTALLGQIVRREANVRAFNDVFALSSVLALLFLFWSLIIAVRVALRTRRAAALPPTPAPAGATRSANP